MASAGSMYWGPFTYRRVASLVRRSAGPDRDMMMMKLRFGVMCALLIACGGKKDATPSSGSATPTTKAATAGSETPAGTPAGKCTFTVTGDMPMTVEAIATKSPPNGKAMAAADYWQTAALLRRALKPLSGLDSKKSKDAIEAVVVVV